MAMFTRDARAAARRGARRRCRRALVDAAEAHLDWPLPGYTHLQRAQPVYLGHHLLAYFWMLAARPRALRVRALGPTAALPLGAGALAGVNFATDRRLVAARARASPASRRTRSTPSPTATSSSTTCAAAATCATHLSRLGAEIVLWSSAGVRLRRAARRLGAAARRSCRRRRTPTRPSCCAPRRRGSSATWPALHGVMHGAPADLQQGHAGGQGAPLRRRRHARAVPRGGRAGCSRASRFTRERMAGAASDELHRRDRRRRPARQARHAVPRGARRRRRARAHGGRVGGRCRADAESSPSTPPRSTTSFARCWRRRSWLESKESRGRDVAARACASSSRTRAAALAARRRERSPRVLRPPGARGRTATSRLHGRPRRHAPA